MAINEIVSTVAFLVFFYAFSFNGHKPKDIFPPPKKGGGAIAMSY